MAENTGGCLCGAMRYSFDAEPISTSVCHCEDCQRHSGTAFAVLVVVPAGSVKFADRANLTEYVANGDSGFAVRRYFCNTCGSSLLSKSDMVKDIEILKAGTLDDRSWLKPELEFWCQSAQPWLKFADELPAFQQNPA